MPSPEGKKKKQLNAYCSRRTRTDRGNIICPFHHSSNGGGMKMSLQWAHKGTFSHVMVDIALFRYTLILLRMSDIFQSSQTHECNKHFNINHYTPGITSISQILPKTPFGAYADNERPRSDCAYARSDLGLRCPLIESLNTIKCINGEWKH